MVILSVHCLHCMLMLSSALFTLYANVSPFFVYIWFWRAYLCVAQCSAFSLTCANVLHSNFSHTLISQVSHTWIQQLLTWIWHRNQFPEFLEDPMFLDTGTQIFLWPCPSWISLLITLPRTVSSHSPQVCIYFLQPLYVFSMPSEERKPYTFPYGCHSSG